jgi:hypothetical protein
MTSFLFIGSPDVVQAAKAKKIDGIEFVGCLIDGQNRFQTVPAEA